MTDGQIPTLRAKWSSLSEYVKEIKQGFSRWYNTRHGRKGFFWGERFKSALVENGDTLVNCLAYIEKRGQANNTFYSLTATNTGTVAAAFPFSHTSKAHLDIPRPIWEGRTRISLEK